ncbi:MAG TPA: DNA polymerase III subunit gamma/tau, partial [candidate division Zixibacteria bacterium]|nr:DNA polymerase III subunit gamma/tau [candidate division Zixibacteria bacterium]
EASVDVREIDAASNTSVEDVRTLRENVRYGPSQERRKRIYIIDEVHRLSGPAFDALLKTLEEPPPHVMFIFATTEPQKVPETIHSRTQRFDFRRVGVNDLAAALGAVAVAEGFTVEDEALRLVARRGEGSVRDSLSLLDQLMAFSSGEVTVELARQALGLVDSAVVFELVEFLAAGEAANALALLARLADEGADIKEFTVALTQHFRTLTLLKSVSVEKISSVLDLTDDELKRYQGQIDFYTIGDLVRVADILIETLQSMKDLDPRWALEIALLKLAHMESTLRVEELLAHFTADGADENPGAAPSPPQPERDLFEKRTVPPERAPATAPAISEERAPHVNRPRVEHNWEGFLNFLRGKSRMLGSQLAMAEVASVTGNVIKAVFPTSAASNMGLLTRSGYAPQIDEALREFFGAPMQITYEISSAPRPTQRRATDTEVDTALDAAERERLLNEDTALRKVVERLDGEILRVKKIKGV